MSELPEYAQRVLAKLLLNTETEGYFDLDQHGALTVEAFADLDEDEAGWLEEFRNRVLP